MSWGAGAERVTRRAAGDDALVAVLECLIAESGSDTASVAAATDLDPSVVAALIDELVSMGVVRDETGAADGTDAATARWSLVHPRVALNAALAERERRLAGHLEDLVETRRLADRLAEVFADAGRQIDTPGIVTLHDRERVMARIAALGREVRDEVCSFATAVPPTDIAAEGRQLDGLLIARGVTLRLICLEALLGDAAVNRHFQQSSAMGVRIRTRPTLPSRMIIFDRSVAVLPIDTDPPTGGALVVDHGTLVQSLHTLFELHWRDSERLTEVVPSQPVPGPRPMELAVLNLLALGHKDDAIARSTGQSARTIRRVVAGLAVTLNARSRFDLALRASARGWIDSPFD